MDLKEELASLLWAGVPLVNLVTYEEDRIARLLGEIDGGEKLGVVAWDLADGFRTRREGKESFPIKDCTSETVLDHITRHAPAGCIVLLRDFHHGWNQKKPYVTRKLRNMAPKLRANSQFLFFTTVSYTHLPLPTTPYV